MFKCVCMCIYSPVSVHNCVIHFFRCAHLILVAVSNQQYEVCVCMCICVSLNEQSLQEMLRKARQQQHNRKAKQHNTTHPKQSFFKEKIGCLGWDSNPRPSAFQAMLLPTKLLRQLSSTCTLTPSSHLKYRHLQPVSCSSLSVNTYSPPLQAWISQWSGLYIPYLAHYAQSILHYVWRRRSPGFLQRSTGRTGY